MRRDYSARDTVRRMRWVGWGGVLLMLLAVVLTVGWKIAQVSERRAMEATREHLAASLYSLVAERVAKGRVLEATWRKKNPFVLLRWQQDNYCGELAAGGEPQSGCWYWLPARAWLVYRVRFADGWTRAQGDLHAWRLLVVPDGMSVASQSTGAVFTLELAVVPAPELAAGGLLTD